MLWIRFSAPSVKSWSGAADELDVVCDVAASLSRGHAGHGVTQRGPLLQRGQDGEFHGPAQGRLPDEQAGQWGVLVHALVGQHPDRLELFVGQQVRLDEDEDGGAAAFLAFGEQGFAGLGDQPGAQVRGGW